MDDIQRADPSARRRAVILLIVGTLIGGSLLYAFERSWPSIVRWLLSDPEQLPHRLATLRNFLVLVTVLPLLAFAVHLWGRGTTIRRHQRFPLVGERLIRDTLVVYGEAAVIRGRVLQCLAVALAVLAIGLVVVLWRLAAMASHTAT
jgi:hypothetical protein